MTPSYQALIAEAVRCGARVEPVEWRGAVRLSLGGHNTILFGTLTDRTSHLAVLLAGDKTATKRVLSRHGLPTPEGDLCRDEMEAVAVFRRIGAPVVSKPNLGAQGVDVRTGLGDEDRVRAAFRAATRSGGRALIERHHFGHDVRVLVVDGRFIAAAERCPPEAVGDGVSTVAQLVDALNADPRRAAGHDGPLTLVAVDAALLDRLAGQGLSLTSAPPVGVRVALGHTANLSRGGRSRDITDTLDPKVAALAVRAAAAVGLDIAGVDLIVDDVTRASAPVILEVNASPGLRMHLAPDEGRPRDVARAVIAYLFPEHYAAATMAHDGSGAGPRLCGVGVR